MGLSSEEFWRSCPRAIVILGRVKAEITGAKPVQKDKRGPRLSYIPR